MSETLLITDRGYKSMSNIQKQLDVGLKFLQCTPLNEKSVRALIDKHSYQLKGIEFYEPNTIVRLLHFRRKSANRGHSACPAAAALKA